MAATIGSKAYNPHTGMHAAGIFADMSIDGPEIGTLVLVVDRAKNLPNLKTMGKQNPYCAARLGKEARKTNTDMRGGQTPRWDQELRFTVHDSPDYFKVKISVFNDDKKTDLIGETWVNLEGVIKPGGGQDDAWHTLNMKTKYAGEIRIELTYYDSRPKPEKPKEQAKPRKAAAIRNEPDKEQAPGMRGPREPKAVKRRPLPQNIPEAPSAAFHAVHEEQPDALDRSSRDRIVPSLQPQASEPPSTAPEEPHYNADSDYTGQNPSQPYSEDYDYNQTQYYAPQPIDHRTPLNDGHLTVTNGLEQNDPDFMVPHDPRLDYRPSKLQQQQYPPLDTYYAPLEPRRASNYHQPAHEYEDQYQGYQAGHLDSRSAHSDQNATLHHSHSAPPFGLPQSHSLDRYESQTQYQESTQYGHVYEQPPTHGHGYEQREMQPQYQNAYIQDQSRFQNRGPETRGLPNPPIHRNSAPLVPQARHSVSTFTYDSQRPVYMSTNANEAPHSMGPEPDVYGNHYQQLMHPQSVPNNHPRDQISYQPQHPHAEHDFQYDTQNLHLLPHPSQQGNSAPQGYMSYAGQISDKHGLDYEGRRSSYGQDGYEEQALARQYHRSRHSMQASYQVPNSQKLDRQPAQLDHHDQYQQHPRHLEHEQEQYDPNNQMALYPNREFRQATNSMPTPATSLPRDNPHRPSHPASRHSGLHQTPPKPLDRRNDQGEPQVDPPPIIKPRAVSPGAANHQIARKSISPRPSVGKTDVDVPFSPDSFAAPPAHKHEFVSTKINNGKEPLPMYSADMTSPTKQNIIDSQLAKDPEVGQLIGNDGKPKDPSDVLPVSTHAPEPEPKAKRPSHNIIIKSRFGPRDAPAPQATVRSAPASSHLFHASSTGPFSRPTVDTSDRASSSGRNKLQKHRTSGSTASSLTPTQPSLLNSNPHPNVSGPYPPLPLPPPVPAKIPLNDNSDAAKRASLADYEPGGKMAALSDELKNIDIGPPSGAGPLARIRKNRYAA